MTDNIFKIINCKLSNSRLFVLTLMLTLLMSAFCQVQAITVKTPVYYENVVKEHFEAGRWSEGKIILEEALLYYGDQPALNLLMGRYYYQGKDFDKARYYLIRSVEGDDNTQGKMLLMQLEQITGHYSDAVCYLNELLEVTPYAKSLWLRKIALYRLMHNDIEADHLLERLYSIYPNDSTIAKYRLGSLDENYRGGRYETKENAIEMVRGMLKIDDKNEEYYLILYNLLIEDGKYDDAIVTAERGIKKLNGSIALARKKLGTLEEQHRMLEALDFAKEYNKQYGGFDEDIRYLNSLLAVDATMYDPYTQYGRIYESTRDTAALNYLINTAVARGYNNDALYYLSIVLKENPNNKKALMAQYQVYHDMGDRRGMESSLEKAFRLDLDDEEIANALSPYYMEDADNAIAREGWSEAVSLLDFVIYHTTDEDILESALGKKIVCLTNLHRYSEALEALDMTYDDMNVVFKNENTYVVSSHAQGYEDIIVPYIKSLINDGEMQKAYDESIKLLDVNPSSEPGLMYVINSSSNLGYAEEARSYTEEALEYYPDNSTFITRRVSQYKDDGEYEKAYQLLLDGLRVSPNDTLMANALSGTIDYMANYYLGKHQPEEALRLADVGLKYSPGNKGLLYDKGLAYEAMKQYDSAVYYQKIYMPLQPIEAERFERHLNGMRHKNNVNELEMSYIRSRYSSQDVLNGLASIFYRHNGEDKSYGFGLDYVGHEGNATSGTTTVDEDSYSRGGTGVKLNLEWGKELFGSWNTTISAGIATTYFPRLNLSVRTEHELGNEWMLDLHGGYRLVETANYGYSLKYDVVLGDTTWYWKFTHWDVDRASLINLGLGLNKDFWQFNVGFKADVVLLGDKLYFSASSSGKFYPFEERITSISFNAGLGTAPEASILNMGLPGSFSHLNTNVGMGANYMLTENLSVGLSGTWFTFYNQTYSRIGVGDDGSYHDTTKTKYKNLFSVNLVVNISF